MGEDPDKSGNIEPLNSDVSYSDGRPSQPPVEEAPPSPAKVTSPLLVVVAFSSPPEGINPPLPEKQ